MEGGAPAHRVDARSARFELAAIAVILLGGYVFGVFWVVPGLAVVIAAGLGFGARANLFAQLFQILLAGRLGPATTTEAATAVRFAEVFAFAVLTVSTLLYVIGAGLLAWPIALVEAGICALHAGTGISVEAAVRDRLTGRRRTR